MKSYYYLVALVTSSFLFLRVSATEKCSCHDNNILYCKNLSSATIKRELIRAPDCPNTKIINLRKNKLSSVQLPTEFVLKYADASLWLDENELSSLEGLNGWHGSGLHIKSNIITHLDLSEIGEKLKYLIAGDNSLTSLDLSSAGNLWYLAAWTNGLEEIHFPKSCLLERIFMSDNNMNDIPEDILRCRRLEEIDLSKNVFSDMPEAIVKLLTLRPTEWKNGDDNLELFVNLRNNNIPSEKVIAAFKRYHEEENKLTVFSDFPDCACATVRTTDRMFLALRFCITSMCGDNNYSKWNDLLQE